MLREVLHNASRKTGLSGLFLAAALALPLAVPGVPAIAQQMSDAEIMAAANQTQFGYIITGNNAVDRMTEAGLRGLGIMLRDRTGVVNTPLGAGGSQPLAATPVTPRGLDIERDDLSLYPLIYWAVDPGQPVFSAEGIRKLNEYMQNGGLLFIDTRDAATNERGKAALRRVVEAGLQIPRLIRAEPCSTAPQDPFTSVDLASIADSCHILARTFYLLRDFDGRYENGQVWVENANEFRHDGVATVIVGGLDWAAAWAVGEDGRYISPVTGSDPKQREYSFRFGINLVTYALTGKYKDDQVHASELLGRMRAQPR